MSEIQSSIKVYELAKELGMDSIGLLDTLKQIDIKVKSHMSSLKVEEALAVKSFFKELQTQKKKKVTKRKRAKKTSAKESAEKASTTVKKVIKRKPLPVSPVVEETKLTELALKTEAEDFVKATKEPETTKSKPTTEVSKGIFQDEMMDQSLSQRKLKIIQDAPPKEEPPPDPNQIAMPPTTPTIAGRSRGKEMFKPITSVLRRGETPRKKTSTLTGRGKEQVKVADFHKREIIFQPKRRKLPPGKQVRKTQITVPSESKRKIKVEGSINVSELARGLKEKPKFVLRKIKELGLDEANLDYVLDIDTASLVATEFKYEIENITFDETKFFGTPKDMQPRPPVVTIMGHVDHGKTTLLDTIRNTSVTSSEAGGITQHIGAYSVTLGKDTITFLDTPGHEAFKTMRQRGANATDIVVLVVAADDGIMPQTVEAIKHAQNASVSIVVAANKMDKPEANLEKLKQNLSENNLLVEDWGGEIPLVPISAVKKTGIKELLETISLQAEILELKSDPKCLVRGAILESKMQKGLGIVSDLLVQQGTLTSGSYVVVGNYWGRIRTMINDQGKSVKEAKPGYPVQVTGINGVPEAGDVLYEVASESDARKITDYRKEQKRQDMEKKSQKQVLSLEEIFAKKEEKESKKHLNVMLKADVYGSIEAIQESIDALPKDKVQSNIISTGIGDVNEQDVMLAKSSNAKIFTFNVKTGGSVRTAAKQESISLKSYRIIYELLDGVKESMEDLLDPIRHETTIGKAQVKQAFNISKLGTIAGSIVQDGKIQRNAYARVYRGEELVCEGNITSIKRFKDEAKEVTKGQECGIDIENYTDIKENDLVEALTIKYEKARL